MIGPPFSSTLLLIKSKNDASFCLPDDWAPCPDLGLTKIWIPSSVLKPPCPEPEIDLSLM